MTKRPALGRRAGLALAALAAISVAALAARTATPAIPPALDLLELPAPETLHGAKRLLLDVTHAGRRLVAVGEFGLIVWSHDGGRQWQQASVPSAVMLTAVSFVDASHGWAVGHDGIILASSDGGQHWLRQFDGRGANPQVLAAAQAANQAAQARTGKDAEHDRELAEDRLGDAEAAMQAGPSRPLMGVRFFDAHTGFAVGAFGQVFQTADAGKTWRYIGDRLPNPEGLHLYAIAISPQGELLIAAEAGKVFRSVDRGQTWSRSDTGYNGALFGVVPLGSSGQLLAYGFGGHLFRSNDGAASWRAVDSPTHQAIVQGVALDETRVLLGEQDGHLLVSGDGGQSFKVLQARPTLRKLSGFTLEGSGLVTVGLGGANALALTWDGDKP